MSARVRPASWHSRSRATLRAAVASYRRCPDCRQAGGGSALALPEPDRGARHAGLRGELANRQQRPVRGGDVRRQRARGGLDGGSLDGSWLAAE